MIFLVIGNGAGGQTQSCSDSTTKTSSSNRYVLDPPQLWQSSGVNWNASIDCNIIIKFTKNIAVIKTK